MYKLIYKHRARREQNKKQKNKKASSDKPPVARKSTLLDKDIYFDESLERAPPLIHRDSYSTITTIDELYSPQNSFEMHKSTPGQRYIHF